jgi:hypothetical protein
MLNLNHRLFWLFLLSLFSRYLYAIKLPKKDVVFRLRKKDGGIRMLIVGIVSVFYTSQLFGVSLGVANCPLKNLKTCSQEPSWCSGNPAINVSGTIYIDSYCRAGSGNIGACKLTRCVGNYYVYNVSGCAECDCGNNPAAGGATSGTCSCNNSGDPDYSTCVMPCTACPGPSGYLPCGNNVEAETYGGRCTGNSATSSGTCLSRSVRYRCERGFYGTPLGCNADECEPCPDSGKTGSAGSAVVTDCYQEIGTSGNDSSGRFDYTDNCYYTL